LWFVLLNQVRVEWSLNPQYAYGWGVPFLCLYLIWRSAERKMEDGRWKLEEARGEGAGVSNQGAEGVAQNPESHLPSSIFYFLLALLALAWLPTRLLQEANPEWRLISW